LLRLTLKKVRALAADERRPQARVSSPRPGCSTLDHARAEIRELHRAVRPGEHAREVEDRQAVERA
jgi:hypothetical protein